MITIKITEEVSSYSSMADVLRRIADLIDSGFTAGYDPDFQLTGEEEKEDN